mmetsp:Transcript_43938/g.98883  ORF Transcript_43938/g.98883 Transcript_43938/m.98883 type:complete len:240 (-) Transcript_43938:94-813(-)
MQARSCISAWFTPLDIGASTSTSVGCNWPCISISAPKPSRASKTDSSSEGSVGLSRMDLSTHFKPARLASWIIPCFNLQHDHKRPGLRKLSFAHLVAADLPSIWYIRSHRSNASSPANESDHGHIAVCAATASSLWSALETKSGRGALDTASRDAVSDSSPINEPRMRALPKSGSIGSLDKMSPMDVTCGGLAAVTAPMLVNSVIATSTASSGGGLGASARNCLGSRPRTTHDKQLSAK